MSISEVNYFSPGGGSGNTTYNVRINYVLNKDKAESDASSLARTFDRLAATVAGAFAVHKLLDFGKRLVDLQSEAERFTLTFATMLTGYGAPGFTKGAESFADAMTVSKEMMMQIRLEASKLPGTAEEFMEIMRASMPGAIQSGHAIMGPDSAFEMSKRLMAAANLLQIPGGSTTVAREFQAMMEGRAQTRNDLFARIRGLMNDGKGIGSKEFNALTEQGRWEQISKALTKLVDPALPTYANTWKAISTTTLNWAQQIARVATGGMFETLKEHLKQMNDWIQANQASIEDFARSVGSQLADALVAAFGYLKETFEFIVKNKDSIITVLQSAGAALMLGKATSGFGKPSVNGVMSGVGLGLGANAITGGSMDFQGIMMGVAGGLISFGGALGVAAAAAVALGAAFNEIDREHRSQIDRNTEALRVMGAATDLFAGKDSGRSTLQSIITEQKLRGTSGSGLDEDALNRYLNSTIDSPKARMTLKDAFDAANAAWQQNTAFGPADPTIEQKLMQKLYDRPNAVPQKPNVNVNVVIRQDISMAEDPERLLVQTKQAIEDALIRPIESGNHKIAPLR